MKTALSSFDLRALVAEWQELVGGYFDKTYQKAEDLVLKINVPGKGRRELFFAPGRWLCLHAMEDKGENLPPFAQTLRRLIDNARITAVEQRGFDRIVTLKAARGPDVFDVVFEVFAKGNLVVVKDGTTAAALSSVAFKDRVVRPGEPYAYPPHGVDPLELDRTSFDRSLREAKGQVVRVLASVINLGGQYAEELCLLAGVAKETRVKDLVDGQVDALYTALNNLAVAVDQERRPALVLDGGRPVDATPVDLRQHDGHERRPFPTFNEALSQYLASAPTEVEGVDEVAAKFDRRIAQQRESLQALREEATRLEAQAHFLYGHYAPFDELLRGIREGSAPAPGTQVRAIDRLNHTVTLAIGDFDAITLDYERDVTANAQSLYDRRREAQLKAQKVEEAIETTRQEMEIVRRKAVRAAVRPKVRATKAMWFDAYRWCLSSEGRLILAGRDARTNDQLVKKHLKEGDRYAHADLHGAPSTVVKEGSKASDATLREACEFALAYSKAWSAGLASGSAYWVLPEQVSKQAESGEFLPRGAFVVRGKRNYLHDLPVRIAVGEVDIEGHRKVMGGPVSAVVARSSRYLVLVPGKEDRERIAKRIATAFVIPIEEASRALPAGGMAVAETHGISLDGGTPAST